MTTIPGSLAAAAAKLEPGMKVCDKITGPRRQLHLERQTHKRNPLLLWPDPQNYLALGLLQPWSCQLERGWRNRSLISGLSPEQVQLQSRTLPSKTTNLSGLFLVSSGISEALDGNRSSEVKQALCELFASQCFDSLGVGGDKTSCLTFMGSNHDRV